MLAEWGRKAELIDRRREVWNLRVRGYSYRAIAEKLGILVSTAYNDCVRAEEEWGSIADNPAVIQQMLATVHQQSIGHLLEEIERQVTGGQVTQQLDAEGNVVSATRKLSLNPQTFAELGRSAERMARLFGLLEQGPAEEAGGTHITNVVLSHPSDGAGFEQWASAAVETPAVDAAQAPDAAKPPGAELPGASNS